MDYKLKKWKKFLEKKLEDLQKVEDVNDKRPPKEWFDNCYKTIKKKNPNYSDKEIRGTCGKIYHKMGVREKIGDFKEDVVNFLIEYVKDLKGEPKKDGSGKGKRKNKGKGGCPEDEQEEEGKGQKEDILPSETVKESGSFKEWCGNKGLLVNGKVTEECIEAGLKSDDKSIQAKAKLARGFATMRKQKKAKDFNDSIVTDFQVISDSMLGGYVVRSGGFQYGEDEHGNPIVRYKDGENLRDSYTSLKSVPAYGSKFQDSHYEADERFIGYWDSFKYVPKGTEGVYHTKEKPDIDYNYDRIWSRLNTIKDIQELSDLPLKELKDLPVSAKYRDLGRGNQQIVDKVYHIALSLNKNEQDRCSTLGGTACNVNLIHDQRGVLPTHDFDNKGVLSAGQNGQPPTNKKEKNDVKMSEEKKEDTTTKKEEEKEDLETTKKGDAPEYEKEKKEVLLEEEGNDDTKSKKKKDMSYEEIINMMTDYQEENKILKERLTKLEPILNRIAKDAETKDAQDFKELQDTLKNEPYKISEEKLEGKDLNWLKEQKDLLDSLPAIQDFYRTMAPSTTLTHENVNKHLFDFGPTQIDPKDEVFQEAQKDADKVWDFVKKR